MRFYVSEQTSPRIGETPEGFLVCYDVPIARTGQMIYNKAQQDVMPWLADFEGDEQGNVYIERDESEVFRPETIASFNGKPVTVDHPDELVSPETFGELTKGNSQNIRRGSGVDHDLMLADLIIGAADAIEYVKSGELRQISCGYDADYEKISESRGRQINIIGNHIALVQKGRAGVRCMILDSQNTEQRQEVVNMTLRDRIRKLLNKTLDEMKEEDIKDLEKKEATADGGDDIQGRLKKIEETLDCFKDELEKSDEKVHAAMDAWFKKHKDAEPDDEDDEEKGKKKDDEDGGEEDDDEKTKDKKKTKDSAELKNVISRAEILVPGYTADSANKTIEEIKRDVLSAAYKTEDGKKTIDAFVGGPVTDFSKLSGATVDMVFVGVSELRAQSNNAQLTTRGMTGDFSTALDPASINKTNAAFWQKTNGR